MNNATLVRRLTGLGWKVVHHGYQYTYVEAPDGRRGEIPFASRDRRKTFWSPWLWDKVKRQLRLQGKEIHG